MLLIDDTTIAHEIQWKLRSLSGLRNGLYGMVAGESDTFFCHFQVFVLATWFLQMSY